MNGGAAKEREVGTWVLVREVHKLPLPPPPQDLCSTSGSKRENSPESSQRNGRGRGQGL